MSLRIERSFGAVSVQGAPLLNCRRFGVPPGGAVDPVSLALANALLGRPVDTPAWEVMGGSLELWCDRSCTVAVAGAEKSGQRRFFAERGERLELALGPVGFTFYVATTETRLPRARLEDASAPSVVRTIRGPQAHLVDFPDGDFIVSNTISRAGWRLGALLPSHRVELRSEPACIGAIQVTPNGTPIILGPDGPTIGGYPKPAVVVSADLHRLGQLRPGAHLNLQEVDLSTARALMREQQIALRRRLSELRIALS